MRNELKEKLIRIYDDRRRHAERARDARVTQYHAQYPELVKFNQSMAEASRQLLRASIHDPDIDPKRTPDVIQAEVEAIYGQKQSWLKQHGLDMHYEDVHPECKVCQDFGTVEGQPCPNCYLQTWVPLLFSSDQAGALPEGDFDSFDLSIFRSERDSTLREHESPRDQMQKVCQFAQRWATGDLKAQKDLTFVGRTGTGKSYTAAAIVRKVMGQGIPAIYLTAAGFFEIIRDYRVQQQRFQPDPARYQAAKALFDACYHVPVLVIDDLGREPNPQKSGPELLELLDKRHQMDLRTLIVSNLYLPDLGKLYDERLTSRLSGRSLIFPFPGAKQDDDLRRRRQMRS